MAALLVQRICQSNGAILTIILAVELLLLSTGLVSALLKLKQVVNHYLLLEIALSILQKLGTLVSSPCYIFLVYLFIVVLILVSSRFNLPKLELAYDVLDRSLVETVWEEGKTQPYDDAPPPPATQTAPATKATATFFEILGLQDDDQEFLGNDHDGGGVVEDDDGEPEVINVKDIQVDWFRTLSGTLRVGSIVDDMKFSDENQTSEEDITPLEPIKISEENERLAEAEEEDTMEATWNAIRGQQEESMKKLKKSETWSGVAPPRTLLPRSHVDSSDDDDTLEATWKELRKSVTFNDAVSASRRAGLARDFISTSDEMKKRCDDFIKNFNDHLRLQRQESEQRFLDAISRGQL